MGGLRLFLWLGKMGFFDFVEKATRMMYIPD